MNNQKLMKLNKKILKIVIECTEVSNIGAQTNKNFQRQTISAFLNQLWQDNPVLKCLKSAKGLHLNVNSLLKQIQMF